MGLRKRESFHSAILIARGAAHAASLAHKSSEIAMKDALLAALKIKATKAEVMGAVFAEKEEVTPSFAAGTVASSKRDLKTAISNLKSVEKQINRALGDSCPDVKLDLLNMRVRLTNMINFLGGKSQIEADDEHIVVQLCKVVRTMEQVMKTSHIPPMHIRIEGHVHKTKNAEKCIRLSKTRAATIMSRLVDSGVSKHILHPVGKGASMPLGDAKDNRRIEVILMGQADYQEWLVKRKPEEAV